MTTLPNKCPKCGTAFEYGFCHAVNGITCVLVQLSKAQDRIKELEKRLGTLIAFDEKAWRCETCGHDVIDSDCPHCRITELEAWNAERRFPGSTKDQT